MKLFFIAIILLLSYTFSAQNSFSFTHDNAGNMTQRKLLVNYNARIGNFSTPKDSIIALSFKVFPNPTNSELNIQGDLPAEVKEAKLRLMNISGQVLKTETYTGQLKTMQVSDLNDGLYLLEVRYSKRQASTYKIIITN